MLDKKPNELSIKVLDGWIMLGNLQDILKAFPRDNINQKDQLLEALQILRETNRERIFVERFKEKYNITYLTYYAGELDRVPEEEIIDANLAAEKRTKVYDEAEKLILQHYS